MKEEKGRRMGKRKEEKENKEKETRKRNKKKKQEKETRKNKKKKMKKKKKNSGWQRQKSNNNISSYQITLPFFTDKNTRQINFFKLQHNISGGHLSDFFSDFFPNSKRFCFSSSF